MFRLVASFSASVTRLRSRCYLPPRHGPTFFNPLRVFRTSLQRLQPGVGKGIFAILEAFRQLIKLEYLGRSMFSEGEISGVYIHTMPAPPPRLALLLLLFFFFFFFFPYLPMSVPTSLLSPFIADIGFFAHAPPPPSLSAVLIPGETVPAIIIRLIIS